MEFEKLAAPLSKIRTTSKATTTSIGRKGHTAPKAVPDVMEAKLPSQEKGQFKLIGGSQSDEFNSILANQAIHTMWTKNSDADQVRKQREAGWAREGARGLHHLRFTALTLRPSLQRLLRLV